MGVLSQYTLKDRGVRCAVQPQKHGFTWNNWFSYTFLHRIVNVILSSGASGPYLSWSSASSGPPGQEPSWESGGPAQRRGTRTVFTAAAMRKNIMTLGMRPHSRLGEEKKSATLSALLKITTHTWNISHLRLSNKVLFQLNWRWNYKPRLCSDLLVVIQLENELGR